MGRLPAALLLLLVISLTVWTGSKIILAQRQSYEAEQQVERRIERERAREVKEHIELERRLTTLEVELAGLKSMVGYVLYFAGSLALVGLAGLGKLIWSAVIRRPLPKKE